MQIKSPNLIAMEALDPMPKPRIEAVPRALRPREILIPFDFSEASFDLLRQAVPMAAAFGATLHVLHVVEPPQAVQDETTAVFRANAEPLLRYWIRMIVADRAPCVAWNRSGPAVDEIILMARTLAIDLIVMASRTYAGLRHVFERSTADHVSRISPCPVLTIPERAASNLWGAQGFFAACRRILLPIDLAGAPRNAIHHALALAQSSNARILLLNAGSEDVDPSAGLGAAGQANSAQQLALELSEEFSVPVAFEQVPWSGSSPVYPILLKARQAAADIIVLPIRGMLWARRLRFASVTDNILRHAPCPVLAINEDAGPADAADGQ